MAKLKISLTPVLKKLEIFTKKNVGTTFLGNYKSVFRGSGLEFEDYRIYLPSDDARLIDWKATLRTNELLVKEFREERELNIFLLIDVSSTMFFGSIPKLKNEYAAELASSLCFAVLQANDAVGFALFSNKIVKKSFPVRDNKQLYFLLKNLTNIKNYGGSCNFKNAIEFAIAHLRPSSILIIISDFIGLGADWGRIFKIAAGKLDVIGIMVRDPMDRTLPEMKSLVLMEDPSSGKQLLVQPSLIREEYKRRVAKQEKMIKDIFRKAGADIVPLSTDKEFSRPITQYFRRKLKQFK